MYRIDMEPIGRRIEIRAGQTLLDAARQGGVDLTALCGGDGWCHGCLVRVVEGKLSPVTLNEEAALTSEQLAAGYRLACQAEPLSHVKIDIPPESLATQQRLQVEGHDAGTEVDPVVVQVDVMAPAATLDDLRSDALRVKEAAAAAGRADIVFPASRTPGSLPEAPNAGLVGAPRVARWRSGSLRAPGDTAGRPGGRRGYDEAGRLPCRPCHGRDAGEGRRAKPADRLRRGRHQPDQLHDDP